MELRAENIVKNYGTRRVVDMVNIHVGTGEIVGLLGPNGAGKTTTFNIIVGLIKPSGGEIFIDDKAITGLPIYKRARHGIGYLTQEPSIFRKMTVRDNILSILETLGIPAEERMKKLGICLEELGITHLASRRAHSLSGGEKRRTEIARALALSPKFLLLDEPFVGIDPITVSEIQAIIQKLKAKNIGILITDHNVRETLEIIDKAYIIYEGKILLSGSKDELISSEQARSVYLGPKFSM